MIYLVILSAALLIFFAQKLYYKKHAFTGLEYSVDFSVREVFEHEEFYVYEQISNNKTLPVPFLKVDTELPEGLSFHIIEKDDDGALRDTFPRVIHSVFVLRGKQVIRRRWRVHCNTRGTYRLGSVTLMAEDIFGTDQIVRVISPDQKDSAVTVLPRAIDLDKHFTVSKFTNGDFSVESGLLTDPLVKAGMREYIAGDPMNRINWKQSAVHDKLMVNLEDYTNRHQFNIIMNMQSRDFEKKIPGVPGSRFPVELCLTVVASILDRVSSENITVKLFSNTYPRGYTEDTDTGDKSDILSKIYISPPFRGKNDMLDALRTLAAFELMISVPIERLLDVIAADPYYFSDGGNIIFVSSFLNERMINFCYMLRQRGVRCIFYITSSNINASIIPDDIEVHYRTYTDSSDILREGALND